MSRFRFEASAPDVVVSLTEAGAAWASVQPGSGVHLVDLQPPLSITHLPAHVQACNKDIRARSAVQGVPRALWVLSSFWLNTWVQPCPTGVASMSELESLVKARATQLFGPAPDGQAWAISADWKSQGHFLCHAAPASVVAALGSDAMQSPLTLALHAATRLPELQTRDGLGWIAITAPGETHLVAVQDGYPVTLMSRRAGFGQDAREVLNQAISLWRIEQARTGQHADRLYWLDGACNEPMPRDELPQAVTPVEALWQRPSKDAEALPPAGRWLTRVLGMQRAFT